ncbi:hypothetical protein C8R44DRAFT_873626 [Mycena epipterygia]|nr:hypothetical protein C8R44DRAFT_873626 [Mycena epipterygia]
MMVTRLGSPDSAHRATFCSASSSLARRFCTPQPARCALHARGDRADGPPRRRRAPVFSAGTDFVLLRPYVQRGARPDSSYKDESSTPLWCILGVHCALDSSCWPGQIQYTSFCARPLCLSAPPLRSVWPAPAPPLAYTHALLSTALHGPSHPASASPHPNLHTSRWPCRIEHPLSRLRASVVSPAPALSMSTWPRALRMAIPHPLPSLPLHSQSFRPFRLGPLESLVSSALPSRVLSSRSTAICCV